MIEKELVLAFGMKSDAGSLLNAFMTNGIVQKVYEHATTPSFLFTGIPVKIQYKIAGPSQEWVQLFTGDTKETVKNHASMLYLFLPTSTKLSVAQVHALACMLLREQAMGVYLQNCGVAVEAKDWCFDELDISVFYQLLSKGNKVCTIGLEAFGHADIIMMQNVSLSAHSPQSSEAQEQLLEHMNLWVEQVLLNEPNIKPGDELQNPDTNAVYTIQKAQVPFFNKGHDLYNQNGYWLISKK